MELLGYISLVTMGVTLGLVGAGGSILTIPILVYLLNVPIILATSYSLILVGSIASVGMLRYRHNIFFRRAAVLLIPSVLAMFTVRHFMIPVLPHTIGALSFDKALVILLLIFMSVAGYFMIKNSPLNTQNLLRKNQNIKVILISLSLGVVMGILGAGGGFMIVPTLVLLMGFNLKEAIPTSLFIIAINSMIGFAADKYQFLASDWSNLVKYLAPALLGMFMGLYIARFVNGESLKKSFGYFLWFVGIVILLKEFIL